MPGTVARVGYLSPSRLKTLARCGEMFRRQYVEGERSPSSVAMAIGNAVHATAHGDGKEWIERRRHLSVGDAEMLAVTNVDEARKDGLLEDGTEVDQATVVDETAAYARLFSTEVAPMREPLSVEQTLGAIIEVPGLGDVKLQCIVDAVERDANDPSIRLVTDVKTSRARYDDGTRAASRAKGAERIPTGKPNAAEADIQLATNAMLYSVEMGEDVKQVEFQVIVKTQNPYAQRIRANVNPENFAGVRERYAIAARQIEADVFLPTTDPTVCAYCAFRESCRFVHKKPTKR